MTTLVNRWLVEDLDTNATHWDALLDEMSADFHTVRDSLVNAQDHTGGYVDDRLKSVDELLHRLVEMRCQLDTLKKDKTND
jgi:hypothetical protein